MANHAELKFGPWIGVPLERQKLCAVEGCDAEGRPQVCPWDGQRHHHGCVHYGCEAALRAAKSAGLKFRKGWGLLCDQHYAAITPAVH